MKKICIFLEVLIQTKKKKYEMLVNDNNHNNIRELFYDLFDKNKVIYLGYTEYLF